MEAILTMSKSTLGSYLTVLSFGRAKYHVAHCANCGTSVAIHDAEARHYAFNQQNVLNLVIPCCDNPVYYWSNDLGRLVYKE